MKLKDKPFKRDDFFLNKSIEYKSSFLYSYIFIIIIFSIMIMRLWYLQILQGNKFRHISENNRIRILKIPASRGVIYDRNKETIAENRPSFDVSIILEDIKDPDSTISLLGKILNMDESEIQEKISESIENNPRFIPIKIKNDISRDELALIEANRFDLPGIITEVKPLRNYIYGEMGAHLLGYIGEINNIELKSDKFSDLEMGDLIGKYGIEKRWDRFLRGINGGRQIEVDATGRLIEILEQINELPGENLVLTIDLPLQEIAYESMKDKIGAVIAMNPKNGEILVMHSSPSYDPNLFAKGISSYEWKNLVNDPIHPLQNRCIQGQYPPGSTFKVLGAIAGLELGIITPETKVFCPGYYSFGRRSYRCWKKGGHGIVDLYQAIVQSCDVYFYNLALRVGVDRLAYYASNFGLGKPTGINLEHEKRGVVPSTYWKRKIFKEKWYEGETLSVGIGQGFNLLTPLQLLNMYSMIAKGGIQYLPRIVKRIEDMDGNVIKEYKPMILNRAPVNENKLRIIREALWGVVNDQHGTGGLAKVTGVNIAGKTGTAQVISLRRGSGKSFEDHAWFVAFAPIEDPEIAVVVLVEHGGHGGSAAAPIAKEIIEGYFDLKE